MTDKKRVACFFTGGFTELNAMKSFVEKINGNVEYRQICPVAPRKSRDAIRNRNAIGRRQNGLTGDSLIDYVLEIVTEPFFVRESYDAVLIEDDRDERFIDKTTSRIDIEKWERFKADIQKKLEDKGVAMPVIILLAAPEVEAWFISDWENGFGWVYQNSGQLNSPQNTYFSTVFRKYVKEEILTDQYAEMIEAFGFFDGVYKKLSEEIQEALNRIDFLESFMVCEHEPIRYSKRTQGEAMLESIEPVKVLDSCTVFFREAFYKLQSV